MFIPWDIYGILWIQRIQNRKLLTRIVSLCVVLLLEYRKNAITSL